MRILFLSRLFYPHIGGVEKHVFSLSQELIRRGHQVTVITEVYDNLPLEETHKKIKIYRMQLPERGNKKLQIWWWFFRHMKLLTQADVIHCHDVFFWYMPFRFLLPFKKVFTTFHGYETVFPPEPKAIRMRKLSEYLSFGNICIGKFIEKWYGTTANVISYGGVHPINPKKIIDMPKKVKVVFIGRLEKDTGILFYESLVEHLIKQGVKIELDVFGAGSLQDSLKTGTYKGITHYVDETLKNYDLLFSSSYLSILDGLNHQMLVVSTYDNKLKKDYLLDTPFKDFILVGTDARAVAERIKKLIDDRGKLTSMLTTGKTWVDEQTWEHLTDQYETLWKNKK